MWWVLLACRGAEDLDVADVPDGSDAERAPVVVYFVADTLGAAAARETRWCERIDEVASRYGLDVACLDGGVAPSSWTAPSHTRMLFPQHTDGILRDRTFPECGRRGLLGELGDGLDATVVFASDNPMVGPDHGPRCDDGTVPWQQRVDAWYAMPRDGWLPGPVEDKAVTQGIDALLEATATGEPAVAFFNALEPGGHFPRCWFAPDTEACAASMRIAIDAGLVPADVDPVEAWLSLDFLIAWEDHVGGGGFDEDALPPLFWETMVEAIEHTRGPLFDDRLDRLLSGLEAQGRLDDLTLVITADHGENPCFDDGVGPHPNCSHGDVPTEWTALVPTFVVPASRADGWGGFVGSAGEPWSTVNLSYALLDAHGLSAPDDWPPYEPPGAATSWTCAIPPDEGAGGVRIVGDVALRCYEDRCVVTSFGEPSGYESHPEPRDATSELEAWTGWFRDACGSE